ncbi:MAG: WYL domain-containing protein [bacterium]|nr:WYL domain-containing protein [bacterium]
MNITTRSKQLIRLVRFTAELKENRYPNAKSFSKKLTEMQFDSGYSLSCSEKTIYRDIELLKNRFDAPIKFSHENNGYYLVHHGWNFSPPPVSDEELLAAVFGAKIAEDIMPEPLRSEIRNAVDMQLAGNNPDFLDTTALETFITASGIEVEIKPKVFKVIFTAWEYHNSVNIEYKTIDGSTSKRFIDPHIITYYEGAWYVKSYCHLRNEIRVFAIHRIINAELSDKEFELDESIAHENIKGHPFNFKTINDIEIWCSNEIAGYVIERSKSQNQKIKVNEDGSVNVYIKSASPREILEWVLSEGGCAKIIKPQILVDEIKSRAIKIQKIHS